MLFLFVYAVTSKITYGIGVDCGSTGSRVYLYQWDDDAKWPEVKPFSDSSKAVIKCSLKLADAAQFDETIPQLVQYIKDHIYAILKLDDIKRAKFTLYATAGMRLLDQKTQNDIIKRTIHVLRKETDFNFPDSNIRVISGQDEAYFAWISVNNLYSKFTDDVAVGITELGGASFQIAQQTDERDNSENYRTFKYNGKRHYVFVYSFLGFGVVEFYKQVAKSFIKKEKEKTDFPCLNTGYLYYLDSTPLYGQSDFDKCTTAVRNILLPEIQKAKIPPRSQGTKTFFGLGGITSYAQFANLSDHSTPSEFLDSVKHICSMTKEEMEEIASQDSFKYYYCLNGILQYNSFTDGFGIGNDPTIIRTELINGVNTSWTMGAILDVIANPPTSKTVIWIVVSVVSVLLIIIIIILVICLLKRKKSKKDESDMLNSQALLGAY
ncbi:hypothetical protein TVAG_351590 [Trichomonas vaginalis G3]|uniref:GDA1/CD39 family protein n=1 Tax=Trichomonas vaginalis (strain ATCC PRA-98 / G3) TaxID=412133 RepID=A2DZP3_TRIV3|nr:8-oxo-dGTP phosphohydrolase protein [Trichomonas vaginalis G3]EAY14111.1 hypothetical protein TVAG_351590 [Trichomonas vaginalis G3]KAI5525120.1 8-oxo-dGTP phosphohydrolase protein [Trichomonas vaginalis G3]|eukprot:XP_001326334.1 hypothetical protein [Trichomonas vaginalis G3]